MTRDDSERRREEDVMSREKNIIRKKKGITRIHTQHMDTILPTGETGNLNETHISIFFSFF